MVRTIADCPNLVLSTRGVMPRVPKGAVGEYVTVYFLQKVMLRLQEPPHIVVVRDNFLEPCDSPGNAPDSSATPRSAQA